MLPPSDSVTITSPDFGFSISMVIFSSRSFGFRRLAAAGDRPCVRDLRDGALDRLARGAFADLVAALVLCLAIFFFAAAFRVDTDFLLAVLAFFFAGVFLLACLVAMFAPL
jgi:hypothetical protein